MKIVGLAAIVFVAAIVPASAQSGYRIGQVVTPSESDPIEACFTIDELNRYHDGLIGCAFGDAANCSVMEDLEKRQVCGPTYKSYVVTGRSSDALQVSPVDNRSVTYWANPDEFGSGD